jgi:osmotically-inducible protein OsmY
LLWSVLGLGLLLGACTPLGLAIGAGAAVGAAAVQERGIEGTTSDAAIRVEINRLWFEADHTLFSGVYLQIQEGRVLLSGSVPDPETRVQVIELTWRATGVREVINEIEVADDSTWSDYAQDSWIVAQLKSKLVVDQEVTRKFCRSTTRSKRSMGRSILWAWPRIRVSWTGWSPTPRIWPMYAKW